MTDFEELYRRLEGAGGASEFDTSAIEIVKALIGRVREARNIINDEGVVTSKPSGEPIEHPAVKVERMASAEIRGWVKDRPDLFGAQDDVAEEVDQVGVFPGLKSV